MTPARCVALGTVIALCLALTSATPEPGKSPMLETSGVGRPPAITAPLSPEQRGTGVGYWHARGSQLYDATGMPVRMTGINWSGPETQQFTFGGLASRDYRDIIDQMADLGYNTLRIPFSSQMLDPATKPAGIDPVRNPDLRGLNSLQIVDKVIEYAGLRGMRVILDRHRPNANGSTSVWHTKSYPESRWIDDWTMLARRYLGNPTVIGAELHNEPYGSGVCWGCNDPDRDWRLAAERAGTAVLSINPEWLIIVNGTDCSTHEDGDKECVWRGGNLMSAREFPVRLPKPDKLVYSAHDYGNSVYANEWFSERTFPNNMPGRWDQWWGYLEKDNIAPVLISEFGSSFKDHRNDLWLRELLGYLGTGSTGMNFCFWALNPTSDTDGLLTRDWSTVNTQLHDQLRPFLIPPVATRPLPGHPGRTAPPRPR